MNNLDENINDVLNPFLSKIENYENLKTNCSESGVYTFLFLIKNIFKYIPKLKSIVWSQYTPNYSDGDTPEFDVYNICFSSLIFKSSDDVDAVLGSIADDDVIFIPGQFFENEDNFSEAEQQLIESLSDFMYENKDILLKLYGDHVEVIVTEGEVKSQHYRHD